MVHFALPTGSEEGGQGALGGLLRSGNHSLSGRSEMREGEKPQEWDLNVFFTISKEPKADEKFLQKV